MSIKILRQTSWANCHIGGQLTMIEWNGVVAYVRENVRYNSFQISANARLGLKRGEMPSDAVQVLELSAPRLHWDAIAEAVAQLDPLNRTVVRAKYGRNWAESQFRGGE